MRSVSVVLASFERGVRKDAKIRTGGSRRGVIRLDRGAWDRARGDARRARANAGAHARQEVDKVAIEDAGSEKLNDVESRTQGERVLWDVGCVVPHQGVDTGEPTKKRKKIG
mmetsp:Transcript_12177/g.32770  ORF Transcript_12177/g.32770 Transcript_12177/m.32770 type:complete len:112 (+) Transcript_12177:55-390(+)